MASGFLSKSRYLSGLQCLKYLWLIENDPDSVPQPDARTQHLFDQGHLVEQLARRLFPDGVEVPFDDFRRNIALTRRSLEARGTLFQAGIMADNLYSRLDVLKPAQDGKWDIVEVKSSTKVKDENLHDISFQKHCCEKHGLAVNKCYLVYINNRYVRSGEIDPHQLFITENVTDGVDSAGAGIEDRIKTMLETMVATERPDLPVGSHCSDPYECPVTLCQDSLPENNILDLYRGGKKRFDLLYGGVLRIRDIPATTKLTHAQETQKWCDVNCEPYVNHERIKTFLTTLKYLPHYLDFETFNTAIPLFDGTRPYQQIPFQFSLHVVREQAGPQHFSFLADGPEDPRPKFLEELRRVLVEEGSIVTYNRSFEKGILEDLGQAFPVYSDWISHVCSRLIDLLEPFRGFDYYHPDQRGSASIKSVLPALTGKSYDEMAISNGDAASLAYLTMTYGVMPEADKQKIRADLEKYCGLDTEGMISIVDKLRRLC